MRPATCYGRLRARVQQGICGALTVGVRAQTVTETHDACRMTRAVETLYTRYIKTMAESSPTTAVPHAADVPPADVPKKEVTLSCNSVKEQLKVALGQDCRLSGSVLHEAIAHIKDVYMTDLCTRIMGALQYNNSKTVTDRLLKVIGVTVWPEVDVPVYHIKLGTIIRMLKQRMPGVRIQQQVRETLQHHLCAYLHVMGILLGRYVQSMGIGLIKVDHIQHVLRTNRIDPIALG
ncbi:hypothetical protein [Infectious spleen and kidney necrosis virus]|uniref:ORF024R n=4 Tax=Infectious spleen and kidney necrosis virus TaxID=180170 RepID=A0A140G0J8_ISKNV|nr:ORF024R [Infectious spleen and kidney necrosis virus]QOE77160.1 hypothetical protein [Banggai cardinalfish iridovirus]QPO16269.1 hypothetical protein [Infectious spleen and kidney necrosis virus]QPO16389.1 hypothetical protein [Infectious spleen and kidney necrosis virus]WOE43501.1 MAG: hypothetical protein [Infectious spleen and kidney necrosis virus]